MAVRIFARASRLRGLWRGLSTAEAPTPSSAAFPDVKFADANPLNHTPDNKYMLYTMAPEKTSAIAAVLPKESRNLMEQLGKLDVLVRAPTLQLLDQLRQVHESPSPVFRRFLLHGQDGCGKTIGLTHAEHFCHSGGWLVVRLPSAFAITHRGPILEQSTRNPERHDQNILAGNFLKDFGTLNAALLSNLPLKGQYKWGRRATQLDANTSLQQLVQMGLQESRYASDVVGVLLIELQNLEPSTRVLYAVDDFNALLLTMSAVQPLGERRPLPTERLSLFRAFSRLVLPTFQPHNGALLLVSSRAHGAAGSTPIPKADELVAAASRGENGFSAFEYGPLDETEVQVLSKHLRAKGWLNKEPTPALLTAARLHSDNVPRSLLRHLAAI